MNKRINRLLLILQCIGVFGFVFDAAKIAYVNSFKPRLIQLSDFLCAFYTAGYLVATGHARELYMANGGSYADAAFAKAARSLLPLAPNDLTAIWMYSPLNAVVFVPFSFLPPAIALTAWQILLAACLLLACTALSRTIDGARTFQLFFISFLFAPVFQAIYMGQLAIPFGLLPLAVGFLLLLLRNHDFPAGLVLSLTTLNPKYLPVAGLLTIVLTMRRRFRSLGGLLTGIALFVFANLALFGTETFTAWTKSAAAAENAFYDPRVIYLPTHLLASLPPSVLVSVPPEFRVPAKIIVYSIAALIAAFTMFRCWRLSRSAHTDRSVIRLSLALLAFVIPLLEPHLLAYDLTALFLSTSILFGQPLAQEQRTQLIVLTAIAWLAIDVDYLLYTYLGIKPHPFIIVVVLLEIFRRLLTLINKIEPNHG
jgi:hypothetical protein